jgi:hypothetical protein
MRRTTTIRAVVLAIDRSKQGNEMGHNESTCETWSGDIVYKRKGFRCCVHEDEIGEALHKGIVMLWLIAEKPV